MRPGHGIVTRNAEDGDTANTTMKSRLFLLPMCLLAFAASGQAQTRPGHDSAAPMRPLNLSLPRDVLRTAPPAFQGAAEDTATRNLRQETGERERNGERLPYGTGYEARQEGAAPPGVFGGGHSGGAMGGGGQGGGGGGAGGAGGRAGMGRGR